MVNKENVKVLLLHSLLIKSNMKSFILNIIVISVVSVFCSCSNNHYSISACSVDTIDIDKAIYKDRILLSNIVSAPRVIILETKKECLIQQIRSMEVYDNKIYILDDKANSLFVFDVNGAFIGKIGERGRGNGEYWDLSDFTIDRENGFIYLWDEALNMINKYDARTRKYVSSAKVNNDGERSFCILYSNDRLYINRTSKEDNDNNYELMEISSVDGKQIGSLLKSSEYNHGWNYSLRLPYGYFYSKNSESPKYIEMFSNKIVSITSEGVSTSTFVQSKDFVVDKDIKQLIEITKKNNYMYDLASLNNADRIYMISNYAELKNIKTFRFSKGWEVLTAFYNTNRNEVYVTNDVENDYIGNNNNFASDFIFTDEKGAYSLIDTEMIPLFIDEVINENVLNPRIEQYEKLLNISPESNPILFFYPYSPNKS